MNFENFFKSVIASRGYNMTSFAKVIGVSTQNLSQKVKRGSISYPEMVDMLKVLNYEVQLKDLE